jgi:hypothetical protein
MGQPLREDETMYGRGPVVKLPHTKAVLLERARRIRIAAMRAKHEVAIIKSGGYAGARGVLPAYKTLEARANAWEAKADRLVREAAGMEEAPSPDNSHRRSA